MGKAARVACVPWACLGVGTGAEPPLRRSPFRELDYLGCVPVVLGLRWSNWSYVSAVTCIYKWGSMEGKGKESWPVRFSGEFRLCKPLCLPLAPLG